MAVADGTAFAASNGWRLVNISVPTDPKLMTGGQILPYGGLDLTIDNGLAYVADADAGLSIIDLADPLNPRSWEAVITIEEAWSVAVSGSNAFVAGFSIDLAIFNVQTPQRPSQRPFWSGRPLGPGRRVAVSGDTLLYSAGGDLHTISVQDPDLPVY